MKPVKLAYKRFETDVEYIERLQTTNLPEDVRKFVFMAYAPHQPKKVWPGEAEHLNNLGYPRRLVWVDS